MSRREPPAFYRSPITRWIFIVTGTIAGYSISPWGPREWHNTPSLRLIHSVIPWPIMTLFFAAYVLLLITGQLRLIITGDLLGMCLYLCATIALTLTISPDLPANLILWSAGVGMVGYHYFAARLAYFQEKSHARTGAT